MAPPRRLADDPIRPPTLYDVAPYRGAAFPQAHPDRLATMATLFGLRPASVEPLAACSSWAAA